MRVGERQHQPPCFVRHVQIPAYLKAVQTFEQDSQAQENQQRPPAETQMSPAERGLIRERHVWFGFGECVTGVGFHSWRSIERSSRLSSRRSNCSCCKSP